MKPKGSKRVLLSLQLSSLLKKFPSFSISITTLFFSKSLSLSKLIIKPHLFVCNFTVSLFLFLCLLIGDYFFFFSTFQWNLRRRMIVPLRLLFISDHSSVMKGFKVVKIVSLSLPVNHRYTCVFFSSFDIVLLLFCLLNLDLHKNFIYLFHVKFISTVKLLNCISLRSRSHDFSESVIFQSVCFMHV